MFPKRLLVALGALALLSAACGTTVSQAEQRAALRNGGQGLDAGADAAGATGDTLLAADGSVDAGGAPTAGGGGTRATAGATTRATTPVTVATAALPATGKGWDKNTIYVGVTTQKDVQTVADGLGAKGLDGGDQEAEALAVINDINRKGGVFGRQVKVIFKDQSTVATAGDPNTAGNEACTYFTQDNPVIAVLNPVTLMDVPSFRACLAKAKVPLFSASVAAVDKQVGVSLQPHFYQLVAPPWDALAPVLLTRLKAQGWFNGWNPLTGQAGPNPVKVGVLTTNDDVGKRVGKTVAATLKAAGHGDAVVYESGGTGDFSGAVLQYSGNQVTHLIAVNADLYAFQISANSQGYKPRYGITSVNAPVTFLQTNSPKGQNNGALGVGWAPSLDVDDARDPGDFGPGETECRRMMTAAGQSFKGKRLAEAVAFAFCDGLRLIAFAAAAGGGLSADAIYAGVQKIAPTFQSGFSFASGLGVGRLFVPGGVRDLAWDNKCDCPRYAGTTTTPL